jgi:hypothetical protein
MSWLGSSSRGGMWSIVQSPLVQARRQKHSGLVLSCARALDPRIRAMPVCHLLPSPMAACTASLPLEWYACVADRALHESLSPDKQIDARQLNVVSQQDHSAARCVGCHVISIGLHPQNICYRQPLFS